MKKISASIISIVIFGALVSGALAQTASQFQSDGVTAIPDGGTVSGGTAILTAIIPASSDSFTTEAICPTGGPPRHIPDLTESVNDWTLDGFEIKPIGTPFDGTGLVPATVVLGGTEYDLVKSVLGLSGTYHWTAHYTSSVGSITSFCDGTSLNTVRTTQGTTGALSFVVAAAPPFAGGSSQFHQDATTPIPDGGSTGGDPFIFLKYTLPASQTRTGRALSCLPSDAVATVVATTQTTYSFDGFEVKPIATPFNGAGLLAPTSPGTLKYTVGAPGGYHWEGHYTMTVTVTTGNCDGTSDTTTNTSTGSTPVLSFTAPAAGGGTIIVASRNAVLQTLPVQASWGFTTLFGAPDPCLITGNVCTGTANGNYTGVAFDTYHFAPTPGSAGGSYALKSIERVPIAVAKPLNAFDGMLAFGRSLLAPLAKAFLIPFSNPVDQPVSGVSLTANFVVLWQPIASMNVSPATLSLSSGSPSASLTVTNAGPAGSNLAWSSTVTYASGAGWLTVVPALNAAGIGGGSSQTVNVTASTGALAPGTYSATITMSGVSTLDGKTFVQTIPVSFAVGVPPSTCGNGIVEAPTESCDLGAGNGVCPSSCSAVCTVQACPPQPACSFTASPSKLVVPQQTSLNFSCTHVTQCNILGGQFGATANAGNALTVTANTAIGSRLAAPTKNTLYTLSCYGELPPPGSNLNYQQSVNVNVAVEGSHIIEIHPSGQ